jgi:hypothetical protein
MERPGRGYTSYLGSDLTKAARSYFLLQSLYGQQVHVYSDVYCDIDLKALVGQLIKALGPRVTEESPGWNLTQVLY